MTKARFIDLNTTAGLERVIENSAESAALVFKHSTSCPISHDVYRAVSGVSTDIHLVVVQRAREVSNAIAQITGIRHESPQAIIIKNGECVFHASHYDIEPETIKKHL